MDQEKNQLLMDLRAQLKYHQLLGIPSYPSCEELVSFLQLKRAEDSSPQHVEVLSSNQPVKRQLPDGVMEVQSTVTLSEIADEVNNCKVCELHRQRIYPTAGKGPDKVRLMIIGDWLAADSSGELPSEHLFGVDQDMMLGKMLEAINLPRQDVFITNVIKCAVGEKCQPQARHVESCVSFLRRQIATLRPSVICTMGMVAARAVLENSLPLSRLRGRFHDYSPQKGINIQVLATYHPTYLLQNTEMKRATWADLQLLAKNLGLQDRA